MLLLVVLLPVSQCEQLRELIRRLKQLRHQEVQQGPQLLYFILKRRARKQYSVTSIEQSEVLRKHTLLVFNTLRFVEYEILILDMRQLSLFAHARFESGQDDVVLMRRQHFLLLLSFVTTAIELEDA